MVIDRDHPRYRETGGICRGATLYCSGRHGSDEAAEQLYRPEVTPLMLSKGQRVEIDLVNRTMMAHPIHLHGHVFQVIAIDGRPIQGAVRDTVLVAPMTGRVRIAFDADNPGAGRSTATTSTT